MSVQDQDLASQDSGIQIAKHENDRLSANFPPGIWSDGFLPNSSNTKETKYEEEHHKLKEEVKKMLSMAAVEKPWTKLLDLIDAVQRLGISYHFEEKIEEILQQMHGIHLDCNTWDNDDSNLYSTSLKFRLLRQHGYKISCDMFNQFKDAEGNFMESLICDVRGMLSFYEATHLRVHGEDILEEALDFTTNHLQSMAVNLDHLFSAQISHALSLPLRKNLPRLEARHYMSVYEEDPSHSEILSTFAKLDFNMLQIQHQKELWDLSRWWKDLDASSKLPFARDRMIECYFWTLGVFFEPEYFLGRKILTKVLALVSFLDDIYDAYGTIDELVLLTQAIERWDISATNDLPEYMKVFYKDLLLHVYKEIEENMIAEGKLYRMYYAKAAIKMLARAYLKEAKSFHDKKIPTMEEFMEVGLITSVYPLSVLTAFLGMGNIVTKDAFDWVLSYPKMITASSLIYRFLDDIMSHEFEQERGHVATSVECYMKQHGVSKQDAVDELYRQISKSWKDINEECLRPFRVPLPVLTLMINLARVANVLYKDGDGYTFSHVLVKDQIASLLVDPVPYEKI
ncbi:hypothetical protein REPUB_Repub05bG0055600 [Reevesia pubescens]